MLGVTRRILIRLYLPFYESIPGKNNCILETDCIHRNCYNISYAPIATQEDNELEISSY